MAVSNSLFNFAWQALLPFAAVIYYCIYGNDNTVIILCLYISQWKGIFCSLDPRVCPPNTTKYHQANDIDDESVIIGPRPSEGAENPSYHVCTTIPAKPANVYYYHQPRKQRAIRHQAPADSRIFGSKSNNNVSAGPGNWKWVDSAHLRLVFLRSISYIGVQQLPLKYYCSTDSG